MIKILKTINGFEGDILRAGETKKLTAAQEKYLIENRFAEEVKTSGDVKEFDIKRQKIGEDGKPLKGKNGPVFEFLQLDENGKAVIDENGNPVYGEEK